MLVGNVQWSTRAYFVVQVCGELAAGVFPPTQDFYSAKIAVDALSDGWRDAIADDLLALVVLFVLQRFCKDVVVGVSRSKLMQDFNLTLRTQVFESIMRQDQVYFDINGADYARRQLDICGHVAHPFLLKPAEILHCLSNIFTRGVYVYILCPTFLYINLFFGLGGATRSTRCCTSCTSATTACGARATGCARRRTARRRSCCTRSRPCASSRARSRSRATTTGASASRRRPR